MTKKYSKAPFTDISNKYDSIRWMTDTDMDEIRCHSSRQLQQSIADYCTRIGYFCQEKSFIDDIDFFINRCSADVDQPNTFENFMFTYDNPSQFFTLPVVYRAKIEMIDINNKPNIPTSTGNDYLLTLQEINSKTDMLLPPDQQSSSGDYLLNILA